MPCVCGCSSPARRLAPRANRRRSSRSARSKSSARRRCQGSARRSSRSRPTCRPSARASSTRQRTGGVAEFLNLNANSVVAQFADRQLLSARRELPRLHRVGAARNAAGPVGVPGWRAHQRSVRRRRQLGPAAEERRRVDAAAARIQSRLRAQHAGRRADDQHEGRLSLLRRRARRSRPARSAASRSPRTAAIHDGGARRLRRVRSRSTTTAGAITRDAHPAPVRARRRTHRAR